MICHKRKIIFIHIPKCAGTSINQYYFNTKNISWKTPNYDVLYGWCPKRKIHLQHATTKQLLETDLISEENWNDYFKFTFVRNPWDRAYSGYLWFLQDRKVKISFRDYILQRGKFIELLIENNDMDNRGVHLLKQTDFFDLTGKFQPNFIGRYENIKRDIEIINESLNVKSKVISHEKKSVKRYNHYSLFYNRISKKLIQEKYIKDIQLLDYEFTDMKSDLYRFKKLLSFKKNN